MVTPALILRQSGDRVYLTSYTGLELGNEHITNLTSTCHRAAHFSSSASLESNYRIDTVSS
jgi:hypothetical protein